MSIMAAFIMASFTAPEGIGVTPQSTLWLLPLAAATAIIYKTTQMPTITAGKFIKEAATLFGSIVVFIIALALASYVLAWIATE